MKRITLAALAAVVLAGCAPLKPADCEKTSALADCKYTGAAPTAATQAAPVQEQGAPLDSGAPDCNGQITAPPLPGYPARAQALRKEGRVYVTFAVKPNGRATNFKRTGDVLFYREAWQSIRQGCYKPGTWQMLVMEWRMHGGASIAEDDLLGDLSSGINAPKTGGANKQEHPQ